MTSQPPQASINGGLRRRAVVHTASMAWQASPSAGVWRKRMHRVGTVERAQVTSPVRFEPGAAFPAHDHPEND